MITNEAIANKETKNWKHFILTDLIQICINYLQHILTFIQIRKQLYNKQCRRQDLDNMYTRFVCFLVLKPAILL